MKRHASWIVAEAGRNFALIVFLSSTGTLKLTLMHSVEEYQNQS